MHRSVTWLLALAFFISGASALTYEILWQRQLMLIFGASAPATTAILTAIFLGIALGSRATGWLERFSLTTLLLYAGVEACIAIWGFAVPWLMAGADVCYVAANHALGPDSFWIQPLRFIMAILVVLPATLAMGATIPLMVRLAAERLHHERHSGVDWAYGINLLGAVAGCLVAGFLLIRMFGLHHTREAAVGANLLVVALCLMLARAERGRKNVRLAVVSDHGPPGAAQVPLDWSRFMFFYFGAGFVALSLEVIWLRLLGIVNTNSNTTFTLALAAYLTGMGIGSLLLYPLLRRFISPRNIFALAMLGIAVAALLTLPTLYQAPSLSRAWIAAPAEEGRLTLAMVVLTESVLCLGLMLLPTLFMGLTFPAVCDLIPFSSVERKSRVASAYFWGTMGSVAGILVTPLLLVPSLGLHGAFAAAVMLSAALFVGSALTGRHLLPRHSIVLLPGIGACLVAAIYAWQAVPVLRNSRVHRVGGEWWVQQNAPTVMETKLLRYQAGPSATVIVKEAWDSRQPAEPGTRFRYVFVDDQMVASTDPGAKIDAIMLAHLPLLLHPDPRRALTVGFGSGMTSHSLTTHSQVMAHCVEIEPEVPRSAHLFTGDNYGVLSHPRFRLILNDARDHLHAGVEQYDVISTDVTNLQYMQNGNLYSVEYFQLMKNRLGPQGVACAWIPMAAISKLELRILLASFQKVFPHASLWYTNRAWDVDFAILIGTPEKLTIDYRRIAAAFQDEALRNDLARAKITEPLQLIHCLQLDEEGMRNLVDGAPLHTDNLPLLEFTSPLSFYQKAETFRTNLDATNRLRPLTLLPYVSHVPAEVQQPFAMHHRASQSFCEFLVELYAAREAANQDKLRHLQMAWTHAQASMAAVPNDADRLRVFQAVRQMIDAMEANQPPN